MTPCRPSPPVIEWLLRRLDSLWELGRAAVRVYLYRPGVAAACFAGGAVAELVIGADAIGFLALLAAAATVGWYGWLGRYANARG